MKMADDAAASPCASPPSHESCAAEPIHVPGAIQPHGAFVALLARSGLITHASANLENFCGTAARDALGCPASKLFEEDVSRSILQGCEDAAMVDALHSARARDGTFLHLHGFRSGAYLCIDIEPFHKAIRQESLLHIAQSIAEPMREAADRIELCELAVSGLKRALGYDRVMAYRFAPDGHGEVIAEAREPHLECYLGLRYPASDIPPQARLLYMRNPVGAIVDSSYIPVPLLCDASACHPPLDLTMSTLRSVSPVHCEYMRNMGTAASLTIGLPGRDGLWGCSSVTTPPRRHRVRAIARSPPSSGRWCRCCCRPSAPARSRRSDSNEATCCDCWCAGSRRRSRCSMQCAPPGASCWTSSGRRARWYGTRARWPSWASFRRWHRPGRRWRDCSPTPTTDSSLSTMSPRVIRNSPPVPKREAGRC